jgi:hypothetical protein
VRCHFVAVLIAFFTSAAFLGNVHQTPTPKSIFEPAELLSATDIPYPFNSFAVGSVVLQVTVDSNGNVEDVTPIHSIPALTEPSIQSIRAWKFRAATLNGKAVRSRTIAAVMFNPVINTGQNPPPRANRDISDTSPPPDKLVEVESAAFAVQPLAAIPGSVVLRAAITAGGGIGNVTVVRDFPPFTSAATEALAKWQFKPAQFSGQPLTSSVAIAFVFRAPPANP